MSNHQLDYHSYLLRFWSERVDGQIAWRASLESSLTGECQGFASLDELSDFLKRQTDAASDHKEGEER